MTAGAGAWPRPLRSSTRAPRHHVPRTPAPRALATPRASPRLGLHLGSRPRRRGLPPVPAPDRRWNGERGLPGPGLPAVTFSPRPAARAPAGGWRGFPGGFPRRPALGCMPAAGGMWGSVSSAPGASSRTRREPPPPVSAGARGSSWPLGTPHGRAGPLRFGVSPVGRFLRVRSSPRPPAWEAAPGAEPGGRGVGTGQPPSLPV